MGEAFHPAVLGRRQRLVAGVLGIGLGVGLPVLGSAVLVARTGELALVMLPLPFLGALWILRGLAPAGYTLGRRALRIERRWLARSIPYSTIRAVSRRRRPIGGLGALGLNGLFGSHGLRWRPGTGLHYLAITNTRDLVFVETRPLLVVLSPAEPDRFAAALEARLSDRAARPEVTP